MFTTQINNFIFPLPPADEQNELVGIIEKMMGLNNKFQGHVASFEKRLDLFNQTILVKAFRGELIPQDPNDEPAFQLLERIKLEKASNETESKKWIQRKTKIKKGPNR